MYEYLKRNKEWLFSGIGVVIIVGIVSLFKSALFDAGQEGRNTQHGVSMKTNVYRESISPVTLDEFNDVMKDRNITELQRQDFIRKHEGRIVKWEGIVANVKQSFSGQKGDIIVVYRPVSQKDKSLPDIFTASFPFTTKEDLSSLSEGDHIEFEGKLGMLSRETNPSPSVSNCLLIKHEKVKMKKP